MSSSPVPPHLSGHHRDTLLQIFQEPTGHNVEWHDVMSLLGSHAWYIPHWLDTVVPDLDIEGSEHLARLEGAGVATLSQSEPN